MRKKIILFITGILLVFNILCWGEIFYLDSENFLKVIFLNVGQGDSAFIETPQKHQILIDGGPDSSALEKISSLMPIWDKSIDVVILTHPEKDHMQGLIRILQRYKADYILWTGVERLTPEYKAWTDVLSKQKNMGAEIIIAKYGQEIKAGNASINILYPIENVEGEELKNTSNNTCIVSKIIFGGNSFLFTGDISDKTEKLMVNPKYDMFSDVLKVAHHGSKYSTSDLFLENVKPKIGVISVGAKNTYGHPTPEVLERLKNFGVKTLRTDQIGDITVLSNGNNIYIK